MLSLRNMNDKLFEWYPVSKDKLLDEIIEQVDLCNILQPLRLELLCKSPRICWASELREHASEHNIYRAKNCGCTGKI